MIHQAVLPLKIERSQDTVRPYGGLALLGEFILGTGLLESADRHLPPPGSGAGYKPSEYIFPLILMLHSGGRSLEDLRLIREDEGLREILPLEKIPTSDATGDWLRRMGNTGGLEGLEAVGRDLLKLGLDYDGRKEYSLDISVAGIEADKESAQITCEGFRGYMPILGLLLENGFIVVDEFRQGNVSPSEGNLSFFKKCTKMMPRGTKIRFFRGGSDAYQTGIIRFCKEKGIGFVIGVDPDKGILKAIGSLGKRHWKPFENSYIASKAYGFKKGKKAFRLIVIRKPYQGNLFDAEEAAIKYRVIATNRKESAKYIMDWYDQQGDYIKNRLFELKVDFGMDRMPCGQFEANAVFFRIGVLAYNIFRLFLLKTLDKSWHQMGVRAILWRLYQIAGETVFHVEKSL